MERTIVRRPILSAIKYSGKFTPEERKLLRDKAWRKSTDDATITVTSALNAGESILIFDEYVVEQLSLLKRFRHAFRVFKAAIARNIGIQPRIIIITLE